MATKVSPRHLTRDHPRPPPPPPALSARAWSGLRTRAFAVWLGLVTRTAPRAHPVPYLPGRLPVTAVPPYISGRTSYLRVRLEFLLYPQVIPRFCNTGGYGPRRGLTPASPCPWVAHPVSGRIPPTRHPRRTVPPRKRGGAARIAPHHCAPCSDDSLSLRLHGSFLAGAPPLQGARTGAATRPTAA